MVIGLLPQHHGQYQPPLRQDADPCILPDRPMLSEPISLTVLRSWLHQEEARHRLRCLRQLCALQRCCGYCPLWQPAPSWYRTFGPLQDLPERIGSLIPDCISDADHVLRQVPGHQGCELYRLIANFWPVIGYRINP
ncbi:MAG: hypothetical protein [Circoviridae sp.]|nr:MAG: hypothetical protein [Circoviridae sp.]